MRCERRWSRFLAAVAIALLAVGCGDDGEPDAGTTSSGEAPATSDTTTTVEAGSDRGAGDTDGDGDREGDGEGDGEGDDLSVTEAPAVGIDVEELCDRLADVDLEELFSEEMRRADPQGGDGCAYASEVDDGEIVPGVEALVTVVRTASGSGEDTVAGDAGGGLPELEGLPELGDRGAMTAFRTQNEYIDTWEAWAFLALDDGLLRVHTRDPAWEDEQDALDATRELLEALDVVTT